MRGIKFKYLVIGISAILFLWIGIVNGKTVQDAMLNIFGEAEKSIEQSKIDLTVQIVSDSLKSEDPKYFSFRLKIIFGEEEWCYEIEREDPDSSAVAFWKSLAETYRAESLELRKRLFESQKELREK